MAFLHSTIAQENVLTGLPELDNLGGLSELGLASTTSECDYGRQNLRLITSYNRLASYNRNYLLPKMSAAQEKLKG